MSNFLDICQARRPHFKVKDGERFTYTQYLEGQGITGSLAVLKREGDTVTELIDGTPGRTAVIRDGKVMEYGWGGSARSVRCASKAEAVRGTRWE